LNTLFYLLVGTSSTTGIFILVKYVYVQDIIAISLSSVWAFVLIMIYSDTIARRENQYLLLAQSFDFHRTLRSDNRIGAVVPLVTAPLPEPTPEPVPEKKSEISKIEFVHTMEKSMDSSKEKTA
jgi:multisubunit Na+/H+ antiporter MnhC subunit